MKFLKYNTYTKHGHSPMLLRISKRRISVEKIFLYYLHARYQQKNMVYDNRVKSVSDADSIRSHLDFALH